MEETCYSDHNEDIRTKGSCDLCGETTQQKCKWYVSIMEPECGAPATTVITVKTRTAQASVPLCTKHKAVHDERAAAIRVARKQRKS